ncbi:MAG: AAA family ATPase [Vicinamibacterales bacterium]
MYEKFYGFRQRPFSLTPDPEFLYMSRVHQEALAHLRLGVESQAGFVAITGEVGAGKTTVLQSLMRTLDYEATVAHLVNTLLEPIELIEAILIDLGAEIVPATKPAMLRDLARLLVAQRRAGRRVLVVIDEAQNLSDAALEELRMLSNFETEKSKLMQILLVGQPGLRARLASPELEQLNQRVTVRYHLTPLDAQDTHEYVNHRLRLAAASNTPMEFGAMLTGAIHERSGGLPRLINVICDAVLMAGYGEDKDTISPALLSTVIRELEVQGQLGSRTPGRRPWSRPTGGHKALATTPRGQ